MSVERRTLLIFFSYVVVWTLWVLILLLMIFRIGVFRRVNYLGGLANKDTGGVVHEVKADESVKTIRYVLISLCILCAAAFFFDYCYYLLQKSISLNVADIQPFITRFSFNSLLYLLLLVVILCSFYGWVIYHEEWRLQPISQQTILEWAITTLGAVLVIITITVELAPKAHAADKLIPLNQSKIDHSVKEAVFSLTRQHGVKDDRVFESNRSEYSSLPDAYSGIDEAGPRIILSDLILREFTRAQISFVVAHEIGHLEDKIYRPNIEMWMRRIDICACFILTVLGWRIAQRFHHQFGFSDLSSPASLLLVALLVSVYLFCRPAIENSLSWRMERVADQTAARLTIPHLTSREAATDTFIQLAKIAGRDPDPLWIVQLFTNNHPSTAERRQFILNYQGAS